MANWNGKPHKALLAAKEEDRFTEYLCQLLLSEEVLAPFLSELCGYDPGALQRPIDVRTQVTVPGGRPDLAICASNGYLLFEAKVSTFLHQNQLGSYGVEIQQWQAAHPNDMASLYLLIPARGRHTHLDIARQQLQNSGIDIHPVTWEEVGSLCTRLVTQVSDQRLSVHLGTFAELIAQRIGEPERPFTSEETALLADPLVARAIVRARAVVEKTKERLSLREYTAKAAHGTIFDGYNLSHGGRGWWYGVWLSAWAFVGETPIFLELLGWPQGAPVAVLETLPQPEIVETLHTCVVPLGIREQVDLDDLAAEHAAIIEQFCQMYSQSGR